MIQRPTLRAALGVALLIGCFTLAIDLRSRDHGARRAPQQSLSRPLSSADVRPLSEVLLLRIARPGQSAVTLTRQSIDAPWQIRDADFEVDQERVASLIATLDMHCTGTLYEPDTERDLNVVAEVLAGTHAFRLLEHERGVSYALERGGYACHQRDKRVPLHEAERIGLSAVQLRTP